MRRDALRENRNFKKRSDSIAVPVWDGAGLMRVAGWIGCSSYAELIVWSFSVQTQTASTHCGIERDA